MRGGRVAVLKRMLSRARQGRNAVALPKRMVRLATLLLHELSYRDPSSTPSTGAHFLSSEGNIYLRNLTRHLLGP